MLISQAPGYSANLRSARACLVLNSSTDATQCVVTWHAPRSNYRSTYSAKHDCRACEQRCVSVLACSLIAAHFYCLYCGGFQGCSGWTWILKRDRRWSRAHWGSICLHCKVIFPPVLFFSLSHFSSHHFSCPFAGLQEEANRDLPKGASSLSLSCISPNLLFLNG